MESSRGGPLSTFIMMLPLIVVPSIAMLKPAGQEGSMLSGLLSAASPKEDAHSAEEIADAVFAEIPGDTGSEFEPDFGDLTSSDDEFELMNSQLFDEAPASGSVNNLSASPQLSTRGSGNPFAPISGTNNTDQLLTALRQMGSTNSIWFDPGDGQLTKFANCMCKTLHRQNFAHVKTCTTRSQSFKAKL
jgi:hypothetical protein